MTAVSERLDGATVVQPASQAGRRAMHAAWAFARYELVADVRGRTLPLFATGFALAAMAVALAGLSAGGSLAVQGFARTGVSLLQLSLWLVPLIALTTSAVTAADGYEMELLAAQPVPRSTLLLGRALGRMAGLAAALATGYGLAGLIIAGLAGTGDALRYLAMVATALALVASMTAVGTLAGALARSRMQALAIALGTWFALVMGVDILAIGLLTLAPRAELTWTLSGLLLLSPVDTARALGTATFGAEAIAGPMGAALRRVLGPSGALILTAGLAAWVVVPLALAARVFTRRDVS